MTVNLKTGQSINLNTGVVDTDADYSAFQDIHAELMARRGVRRNDIEALHMLVTITRNKGE